MDEPIKIGHTIRPIAKRFREWQLAMPFHEIKLIAAIKATKDAETFVKQKFRKYMIPPKGDKVSTKSEWFNSHPEIVNFIHHLRECQS